MSWSNFKYVLLVLLSTPLCLFGATDDNELRPLNGGTNVFT